MKLAQEYIGNLSSSNDVDYYKFEVPNDGNVTITLRHDDLELSSSSKSYWNVFLYSQDDPSYSPHSFSLEGDSSPDSIQEGIPAGTYFIKITKSNNYSSAQYYLKVGSDTRMIILDSPKNPGRIGPENVITIRWTTTGALPDDKILISMKRDLVPASVTVPDNIDWYRFTEHGSDNSDDGEETVTIPSELAPGADWRFYVGYDGIDIWNPSETFQYNLSIVGDVNGDGEIGLEEAIHALQVVAGIK